MAILVDLAGLKERAADFVKPRPDGSLEVIPPFVSTEPVSRDQITPGDILMYREFADRLDEEFSGRGECIYIRINDVVEEGFSYDSYRNPGMGPSFLFVGGLPSSMLYKVRSDAAKHVMDYFTQDSSQH